MQLRKDGTILPRHGNHQAANDPRHPAQLIEHDAIRNNHYQPTHGPQMNSVRESPAMQVVRDGPVVNRFESDSLLADAVATLIANAVDQGVTAHGDARLVLSGGNTPAIFLPRTVALDLPWNKVTIFLADERWVDASSADSNAGTLRRAFRACGEASKARIVSFDKSGVDIVADVANARRGLPSIEQKYDLVLLGMGGDGHFASMFPGTPGLAQMLAADNTERLVAIPSPTTAAPHVERISMTLAEISRSRRVVLVIKGEEKLRVLEQARADGNPLTTPVCALGNVEVFWCP